MSIARKFTFERGKVYVASILLTGLKKFANEAQVAQKVAEALGMRVSARKIKPGEFVVTGTWTGDNREVALPSEVFAVKEVGA